MLINKIILMIKCLEKSITKSNINNFCKHNLIFFIKPRKVWKLLLCFYYFNIYLTKIKTGKGFENFRKKYQRKGWSHYFTPIIHNEIDQGVIQWYNYHSFILAIFSISSYWAWRNYIFSKNCPEHPHWFGILHHYVAF